MILHDDLIAFVRQLIDEQGAAATLGDAMDLIAHRRVDQIAIAAGLQSADAVSGTFTNVPGAASPYTNPISGPAGFFRLKH